MKKKLLFIVTATLLIGCFTACGLFKPKPPKVHKKIQYTVFVVDTLPAHPNIKYFVNFDKFHDDFDLSISNYFVIDYDKLLNKDSLEVKVIARDITNNHEFFLTWYIEPLDFNQAACGTTERVLYKSVVLNNPNFNIIYHPGPGSSGPVPIGANGPGQRVPPG